MDYTIGDLMRDVSTFVSSIRREDAPVIMFVVFILALMAFGLVIFLREWLWHRRAMRKIREAEQREARERLSRSTFKQDDETGNWIELAETQPKPEDFIKQRLYKTTTTTTYEPKGKPVSEPQLDTNAEDGNEPLAARIDWLANEVEDALDNERTEGDAMDRLSFGLGMLVAELKQLRKQLEPPDGDDETIDLGE